jgi:hypothetical protein
LRRGYWLNSNELKIGRDRTKLFPRLLQAGEITLLLPWPASSIFKVFPPSSSYTIKTCLRHFRARVFLASGVKNIPLPAGANQAIAKGTITFDDTVIGLVTYLSEVAEWQV